jgi:hypothetical protein
MVASAGLWVEGDHGTSMRRKGEIIGKLGKMNLVSVFRGLRGRWGAEGLTWRAKAALEIVGPAEYLARGLLRRQNRFSYSLLIRMRAAP